MFLKRNKREQSFKDERQGLGQFGVKVWEVEVGLELWAEVVQGELE